MSRTLSCSLFFLLALSALLVGCDPDVNETPISVEPVVDAGEDMLTESDMLKDQQDTDVDLDSLDAMNDLPDSGEDMPPGNVTCANPALKEMRVGPESATLLQDAVDQAAACDVPIYLEAGEFLLDEPIKLPGKLTLEGAGEHHTTLTPRDGSTFEGALLEVTKSNRDFRGGLILRGFELKGAPVGLGREADDTGDDGSGLHWALIERVVFHYNDRALTASGIGNVFRDVTFVNNNIHVDWEGETTHTRFDHCRFESGARSGQGDYALRITHTRQLIFDHCVFEQNKTAELGTVLLRASHQVIFRDCWFELNGVGTADPADSAEVVTQGWDQFETPTLGAKQIVFEGTYFYLKSGQEASRDQIVLARDNAVSSVLFRDVHGNVAGADWAKGVSSSAVSVEGLGDPYGAAPRP